MQVAPSGGQICNQCKWRHLVAKFGTNASGAIWWPIFQLMQLMQVAPSCGQFFNSCKWRHLVAKFGTNASGATISWRDNSSLDAIPWVRCASGNVLSIRPDSRCSGVPRINICGNILIFCVIWAQFTFTSSSVQCIHLTTVKLLMQSDG